MPNRNYIKGANMERRAKAILEKAGYIVFRMAGSKGEWDLIAFSPKSDMKVCGRLSEFVTFIQVKYNCRPSKAEMKAIQKFPAQYKELWIFKKGIKEPTIEQIPNQL